MSADPLKWLESSLQSLKDDYLYREPTIRSGPQSARIVVNGCAHLNFSSNDYLGIANDPEVIRAIQKVVTNAGWGSGASPLVTGRTAAQAELERHLAAFENTEAALVFPSGFAANSGTLSCLTTEEDVIFSDANNHASLIDGCRLSRAQIEVYDHVDMNSLRKQLSKHPQAKRRVIVTDGLFSMDGDLAPLPELAEIAEHHQAILVVDEAHATGVLGSNGRGACEYFDVEHLVPIRIGTMSKALGSIGGFVVGSQPLVDWLFNRTRSFVFSTALPAACHVAAQTALSIIKQEPQRRISALHTAQRVREELTRQGWSVGEGISQIIPVRIGDPRLTMQLAEKLREASLWVAGIRPPSVQVGSSMLRISVSYAHQHEDIDRLLTAMANLRHEFD